MPLKNVKETKVYELAFELAMEIFEVAKTFAKDFSGACKYINQAVHKKLNFKSEDVGRLLNHMINNQ